MGRKHYTTGHYACECKEPEQETSRAWSVCHNYLLSLIDAERHEILVPFAYQETCNLLYRDDKVLSSPQAQQISIHPYL